MKNYLDKLDKAFENRLRLGIMSLLTVNESVDFTTLKEMLEVTDGNLASHISALEKEGYIEVRKKFIDRKPNTSYAITRPGRKAFEDHISALEQFLKLKQTKKFISPK